MSQTSGPLAGLWIGPTMFGGALILAGIMVFLYPNLVAYAVSLALIIGGAGMIAMGMASRMQVSYRRIDIDQE